MDPEQTINTKDGIRLLRGLELAGYAIEAAICGDNGGPLTSSLNSRRNMSLHLAKLGKQLTALADHVNPLTDDANIRWQPADENTTPNPEG